MGTTKVPYKYLVTPKGVPLPKESTYLEGTLAKISFQLITLAMPATYASTVA